MCIRDRAESSAEERGGVLAVFRGQDFGIGQARVVVDANEDDLPAYALFLPASIPVDPVSHAFDPGELLGVDVEQISGPAVLIALGRGCPVLPGGSNDPLVNADLPGLCDLVCDFALEHAAARATSGKPPVACGLSDRELQVLCYVAAGSTNREIAASLSLSRHTVARHVSSILKKTELANRVALAAYAARHGLGIEDE